MSEDYVRALRTELASCEETGNPRGAQVREALAAAGHPAEEPKPKPAPKRGAGRPRKETAEDKTPREKA